MGVLRIGVAATILMAAAMIFADQPVRAAGLEIGTLVTFDQPIEIPGRVLPAGTYAFTQSGPSIVQVWDKYQTRLIATLLTNSAEQREFEPRQEFEFDSNNADNPKVLKAWFIDSGILGHEFIYNSPSKQ
jgi:hypothetical protein